MKKQLRTLAMGIIAATLLFTGCTKDGATGPAGPAGANGSANIQSYNYVIASTDWIPISSNEWQIAEVYNTDANSAVLAYLQSPCISTSTTDYQALPYYDATNNVTYGLAVNLPGNIAINYYTGSSTLARPSCSYALKVIIIPPAMIKPNVNHHNYAEVKTAYNL